MTSSATPHPAHSANQQRKAARLVKALDDLIDRVPDVIDTIDARAIADVVAEWSDESWAKLLRRIDPKGKATVSADTRALVIGGYRRRAMGYGQRPALPDLAERIARAFEPRAPIVAAPVPRFECSVCGGLNCHREACAEDAGRLGLPRERRVA